MVESNTMTDHSKIRKAKIALASVLLSCSPDYFLTDEGKDNLDLMGVIMRDKDIQLTLTDSLNKGNESITNRS